MRTFSRIFLLVLGVLVGSAVPSYAVINLVEWVDLVFMPTYFHYPPSLLGGTPASGVTVTVNGSIEWDSQTHQVVAGLKPVLGLPSSFTVFDPQRWTVTGVPRPLLFQSQWESGQGAYVISGEVPGTGGIIQFLLLSAPSQFPEFTVGTYDAASTPGNAFSVVLEGAFAPVSGQIRVGVVPELAILRTFPRHIYGRQLAAFVNPSLQYMTAWGAATMLRAIQIPAVQRGIYVDLPSVRLEVQEWCSGLVSMKWLLLLAVFIALVGSGSVPWKIALVVIAPLIALEANMLRVAGFGLGLELGGYEHRHALKDGMGWVALALGVVQVIGLGRLMNRQRIL